jgi:PKD domain
MGEKLKNRRILFLAGLGVVLVVVLVVLAVSALGGDDNNSGSNSAASEDPYPENRNFHTFADAAPFANGAPMTSHFTATPYNAKGDVKYFWRFDDGTTSTDQNPTHTFVEPGTYSVFVDSRDDEGNKDRYTLILGVWPKDIWQTSEKRRLTQTEQLNAVAAQTKRTAARRKQLKAEGKGSAQLLEGQGQ